MSELIRIRDATAADTEAVAMLHLASWRSAYRGIISDAFLDGPARENRLTEWHTRFLPENARLRRIRLATAGDEVVGLECMSTIVDPQWGYWLDNLHVHPEWKGRGVGRMMLRDAAAWVLAQAPGLPMHLWTYELNVGARGFYDRMGGEVADRMVGRASDGSDTLAVRYVWRDPAVLIGT